MSSTTVAELDTLWDSSRIESIGSEATRLIMSEMARGRFGGIEHEGSLLFPDISKLEGETKTFAQLTKDNKDLKQKLIASKKLMALAAQNNPKWLSNKLSNLSAWKEFSSLATGTSGPGATSVAPWTESGKTLQQWFEDSVSGLDGAHLAELHNMLRSERLTRKLTNSEGKPLFGAARKSMRPAKRDASQYATVKSISSALNPTGTDETSVQIASEVTADSEWLVKKLINMRSADGAKRKGTSNSSAKSERSRARSKSAPTRSEKPSVAQTDIAGSSPESDDDWVRSDKPTHKTKQPKTASRRSNGRSTQSKRESRGPRPLASQSGQSPSVESDKPTTSGGTNARRARKHREQRETAAASSATEDPETTDVNHNSGYGGSQTATGLAMPTRGTWSSGPPPPKYPPQQLSWVLPQQFYGPAMQSGYPTMGQSAFPPSTHLSFPTGRAYHGHGDLVSEQTVYSPTGPVVATNQRPGYPAPSNYWSNPSHSAMPGIRAF